MDFLSGGFFKKKFRKQIGWSWKINTLLIIDGFENKRWWSAFLIVRWNLFDKAMNETLTFNNGKKVLFKPWNKSLKISHVECQRCQCLISFSGQIYLRLATNSFLNLCLLLLLCEEQVALSLTLLTSTTTILTTTSIYLQEMWNLIRKKIYE